MKRAAIILAVALAALLTGCTAAPAISPSSTSSGDAQAQRQVTPTVEPLVATTPTALALDQADSAYLAQVRDRLAKIRTQIPNATDKQLLDAAHNACSRLNAGESGEHMTLIEGETTTNGYYMDSGAIIIAARMTMCPKQ